ncbi:HAD family hydrolase [Myxacorys almedinensis]|uniref:HAD-IA family hydrolase n=1 Tax=Myxacorys almedinensis A TaxID=2690445 RepID=A0A8J7Z3Q2_9CYAN|nr:HAD family phosphatase [Myxacorys almedinensis]NDJ17291.1 HAD-IA family hydrolase [Myxacorys almedinensis A]
MSLKAILFDFNGVIINDEPLHERLIEQLLIEENLRPNAGEFREFCLGRSDRACLRDLLTHRGRTVTDAYLETLVTRKARAYVEQLQALETLPIYLGLEDLLFKLKGTTCKLAIVSGAVRAEIELVLERAQLRHYFSVIVSGDDVTPSKPEPDGYLLAIAQLNHTFSDLQLQPFECLAIEDTFAGIEAAKRARVPVLGVANTYPFHMLQRRANWTVDHLSDLELDRVQETYEGGVRV